MGNAIYIELCNRPTLYHDHLWAERHTHHGWRERYKRHQETMDHQILQLVRADKIPKDGKGQYNLKRRARDAHIDAELEALLDPEDENRVRSIDPPRHPTQTKDIPRVPTKYRNPPSPEKEANSSWPPRRKRISMAFASDRLLVFNNLLGRMEPSPVGSALSTSNMYAFAFLTYNDHSNCLQE